ncbi:MAG: cupin domain-containing protein [Candidatus Eisenbacteria bacterium]|nr:cupin domain-containing protein [Candidatus Eisenbacteria bacterium]
MLVKDVATTRPLTAADHSEIRELLHPERDPVALGYSLAHAFVKPGAATLPHALTHTEVYYIIEGQAVMHVGDESRSLRAGHAVCVPPGATQWIENAGKSGLAFLCIVSPPWTEECEVAVGPSSPAGRPRS